MVLRKDRGEEKPREFLKRRITRRQAIKAGGLAAAGLILSKPLIKTIRPTPVLAADQCFGKCGFFVKFEYDYQCFEGGRRISIHRFKIGFSSLSGGDPEAGKTPCDSAFEPLPEGLGRGAKIRYRDTSGPDAEECTINATNIRDEPSPCGATIDFHDERRTRIKSIEKSSFPFNFVFIDIDFSIGVKCCCGGTNCDSSMLHVDVNFLSFPGTLTFDGDKVAGGDPECPPPFGFATGTKTKTFKKEFGCPGRSAAILSPGPRTA